MNQQCVDFEYCLEAWQRYVTQDPHSVVLSDSLGHDIKRNEVDEISGKVYAYLKTRHIGKEDFVLVNLERGVKPFLAVLGILKAGAAFSIVENNYAKERIDYIRQDCEAVFEINEETWVEILNTEPISGFASVDDHDVCLSVYTSGTTGTPKGVIHEYGQLKLEMLSEQRPDGTWREDRKTRWALVAPFNFVASLKIIVHALYCGGHLYVLDYDTVKNPKKLSAYFFKNRINETFLSPSIIRVKGDDYGPFMKYIYTGAEPANNIAVKKAELVNTYTMSESFFTVCEFIIDKPYEVVPIGNPLFELPIKLLKENGEEAAPGEIGEFCYYNPYCRGYLHNEKENEKHFIDGWFHTGDLAIYSDGQYTLKGRNDDMIKIDGNRIEPSEIEAACNEVLDLEFSIAKGFEQEGLVVLYTTSTKSIDAEKAKIALESRLPYYMIPALYVHLDQMPMTQSGKLDKKGLRLPLSLNKAKYVAPRDAFEETLCELFSKCLGIEDIGIQDDFFNLGGSSVKLMSMLGGLPEDTLLTPSMVYHGRTVEKVSELYKEAKKGNMSIEEKEEEGKKANFPISSNMQFYWHYVNDASLDFYNCYKLAWFIPAGIIEKRLNKYIKSNSTFNMVLTEDEDGTLHQTYCEESPKVVLEKMSSSEVTELIKTFVQPFGLNEPLIRIRLVKSGLNTYLFFHAFHMITDGNGIHLLFGNMMDALLGKSIEPTYYFAWAFDENIRDQKKEVTRNHEAYFRKKYVEAGYGFSLVTEENPERQGIQLSSSVNYPLNAVQKHCDEYKISVNLFIVSAALMAVSAYNKRGKNCIDWNFNNRGPKDNPAGVMVRFVLCGIDRNAIHNLKDLYRSVTVQNEESLWRVYERSYTELFTDDHPEQTDFGITYLEDWFTGDDVPTHIAKEIALENHTPCGDAAQTLITIIADHRKGNLCCALQYGLRYLEEEKAEHYMRLLNYAMGEMLKGRLPWSDGTEH